MLRIGYIYGAGGSVATASDNNALWLASTGIDCNDTACTGAAFLCDKHPCVSCRCCALDVGTRATTTAADTFFHTVAAAATAAAASAPSPSGGFCSSWSVRVEPCHHCLVGL